jgi:hypothetical protein
VKQSLLTSQLNTLANLRYTGVAPRLDPAVVAARVFPREIELRTFTDRSITLRFQRLPAPPTPADGSAPPPAAPRPVYVELIDSEPDALLAAAARTHAFEIAEWVFNGLPAKAEELFEPLAE